MTEDKQAVQDVRVAIGYSDHPSLSSEHKDFLDEAIVRLGRLPGDVVIRAVISVNKAGLLPLKPPAEIQALGPEKPKSLLSGSKRFR